MALGGFPMPATSLRAFIWVLAVASGGPSIAFHILIPRSAHVHSSLFDQISSLSMSHFIRSLPDSPSTTVTLLHPLSAIISSGLNAALVQAQLSPFTVGSSLSCYQAIPSPSLCPAPFIMPRERPRMGCRRGSAQGRAIRQHSPTSSEATSEASEFSSFSYPATRSGRGKGRGPNRINVGEHHSHSHTARFRIPCSLGNASFIVSVAIELIENAVSSGDALQEAPQENRRANQSNLQPMSIERQQASHIVNDGPCAPLGDVPLTSAAHPSDSIDSDQFGCHIVEENPMTSNEI